MSDNDVIVVNMIRKEDDPPPLHQGLKEGPTKQRTRRLVTIKEREKKVQKERMEKKQWRKIQQQNPLR